MTEPEQAPAKAHVVTLAALVVMTLFITTMFVALAVSWFQL